MHAVRRPRRRGYGRPDRGRQLRPHAPRGVRAPHRARLRGTRAMTSMPNHRAARATRAGSSRHTANTLLADCSRQYDATLAGRPNTAPLAYADMRTLDEYAAVATRSARRHAGMSVRRLAQAAGVPASTVTRVENGHVDPSVSMLRALLAATGHELMIATTPLRLAGLSDAWIGDEVAGRPDWTLLRAWLDALADANPVQRAAAIAEQPAPGGGVLDNLLAGVAEAISDDDKLRRPPWTSRVAPLEREWSEPSTPRMLAGWRASTPAPLAARHLTLDAASLWRRGLRSEPDATTRAESPAASA